MLLRKKNTAYSLNCITISYSFYSSYISFKCSLENTTLQLLFGGKKKNQYIFPLFLFNKVLKEPYLHICTETKKYLHTVTTKKSITDHIYTISLLRPRHTYKVCL